MVIPINSNTDIFFRQFIGLLSNFPPLRGLRPRELDVLAEICKQYYKHKDSVDEQFLQLVIFSTENRKVICKNVGISEDVLNNNLSILRKKKILTKDNSLLKVLRVNPSEKYDLLFKFTL